MVNKKKMTKMDWFETLKAVVANSDMENKIDALDFINHEIELLEKKSESSRGSKRKEANETILTVIKEVLATFDTPATISELMEDERLAVYMEEAKDCVVEKKMTCQKLSSLLKKLVDTNVVVKTYEKKKAYFSLS